MKKRRCLIYRCQKCDNSQEDVICSFIIDFKVTEKHGSPQDNHSGQCICRPDGKARVFKLIGENEYDSTD
ncbi:MAG: hypothetical protein KAS32_25320 [Candidatus Peribacteraceae bacterium]|nr:hypothetical protein [Candidatus Peribacteraceae bacterium]